MRLSKSMSALNVRLETELALAPIPKKLAAASPIQRLRGDVKKNEGTNNT